jgi:hypothetical protein
MKNIINDWKTVIIFCLTLGLAPFTPEPHIVANLRWVVGGAVGMTPMNWFDLLMHGTPFILLFRLIFLEIKKRF